MKHRSILTQTESRRMCLFCLNISAIAGIIIGALIAVSATERSDMLLHQYFSPIYSGNTVFEVFRNTFLSSSAFLLAVFILGFTAVGQPFGVGLISFRGVGIGFSVAQMYLQRGIEAVPSVLLLIVPKAVAIVFLLSLAVREMLKLSCCQFRFMFLDYMPDSKVSRNTKLYCVKFAVIAVILILISVLDSALNYIFMDLI